MISFAYNIVIAFLRGEYESFSMLERRLWGFRMDLKRAEEVLCEGELELSEFIRIVGSILRNGGVSRTIAIDSNGRVVENAELCITLKKIGVKYIPVSHEVPEEVFIPLESLGFFEDISPNKYRVFNNTEELLYRNWPTPFVKLSRSSVNSRVAWGFSSYVDLYGLMSSPHLCFPSSLLGFASAWGRSGRPWAPHILSET